MKLLFAVNQRESLFRGVDAPTSSVTLEVDPANLADDERSIVAQAMTDGYDCRKKVTDSTGQERQVLLPTPDLDGLFEALDDVLGRLD